MARFCTECGKEIANGIAFCTECGAKAPDDTAPLTAEQPVSEQPVATQPQTQQTYQQPTQVYQQPQQTYTPSAPDPAYKPVGTGTYFGLMILFAIPIIGFIACIIMTKASGNKSLKNYAKATLIWYIISFVMIIFLTVLLIIIGGSLMSYISQFIPV